VIIGLTGRKYSGKTTAAEALEGLGFEPQSFAWTLKMLARILMRDVGLTEQQIVEAQLHKEQAIPLLGVSFRYLCQTLGTEWGRTHIHPDVWVMAAAHKVPPSQLVVFDDVRFENEAAMIRKRGGLIIHIKRPLHRETDNHASEAGIAFVEGDELVMNAGSKDDFIEAVFDIGLRFKQHVG